MGARHASDPRGMRPERRRTAGGPLPALLVAAVLLGAACAGPTVSPTPGPSSSTIGSPTPSAVAPTGSPTPSLVTDPFVGRTAVTVTPDLRVRSQPRVADDSEKYTPLLAQGTELTVIGGPVAASGYLWYQVIPLDVALSGGHTSGWVAAAAKDGTPWIAPKAGGATGELAISSVARSTPDPAAAKAAAGSINAFGFDLYRALLETGTVRAATGAVISPTSVALALAMTQPGARGATASELATLLHTAGWDAFGAGLNALTQELAGYDATWTDDLGAAQKLALRIANAAFAQRGYAIQPSYLDQLARSLGAGIRLVDYVADPEDARGTINRWVSDRTQARIPELLLPGTITGSTRLVLVNAIYLKAAWALLDQLGPFDAAETRDATFTRLDGSTVAVPTMRATGGQSLPYAKGSGWEATELLYQGANGSRPLAMTFVKPADFAGFERTFDASGLRRVVAALDAQREALGVITGADTSGEDCGGGTYPYSLSLRLPRFGLDTRASVTTSLRAMGLTTALDPTQADFSGITGERDLFIGDVIHQANLDLDEKGTEAAAATAVIMDTGGGCFPTGPAKTITLKLDHPFLFFLRDVRTGAVLFMGRVLDPTVRG